MNKRCPIFKNKEEVWITKKHLKNLTMKTHL